MRHYKLFIILLLLSFSASAKDFPEVTPATYTCKPDMCNSCHFRITGFPPLTVSVMDGGCTEMGCFSTSEISEIYKKCSKDWRDSKNISFRDLSDMENACVNGVRNHNYWEDNFGRKEFDKNYAFAKCLEHHHRPYEDRYSKRVSDLCQTGWEKFVLSEQEIFYRHAELSANYAHFMCKGYFDRLEKEFGFAKNELVVLAKYIASRQFPYFETHIPQTLVSGKKVNDIEILNNIFSLLNERKWVNIRMVVMPNMVEEFKKAYQAVITD